MVSQWRCLSSDTQDEYITTYDNVMEKAWASLHRSKNGKQFCFEKAIGFQCGKEAVRGQFPRLCKGL